jgi:hypothetical protein
MAVNLSAIKDLLLPGLRGVEGKYEQIPSQYDKIFTKHDSKMALERTAEMRFLGLAQLKTEGGQTAFDNNAGERYVYNQEHTEIALGYAITRKAIDDNLYKTQFAPSNLGLIESFQQTKEIYGANVLNTSSTYNASIGGDGVSLVNTAHPIDGGTVANRPAVDVDLNEFSDSDIEAEYNERKLGTSADTDAEAQCQRAYELHHQGRRDEAYAVLWELCLDRVNKII